MSTTTCCVERNRDADTMVEEASRERVRAVVAPLRAVLMAVMVNELMWFGSVEHGVCWIGHVTSHFSDRNCVRKDFIIGVLLDANCSP